MQQPQGWCASFTFYAWPIRWEAPTAKGHVPYEAPDVLAPMVALKGIMPNEPLDFERNAHQALARALQP